MADPDQDRLEKFDITPAPTGETCTLLLKTKSEEFECVIDRQLFQELGDAIYDYLDKTEQNKK